ncbi:MAG: hypothetical protein ACYC64_06075 [Armatimonadota bacterium]
MGALRFGNKFPKHRRIKSRRGAAYVLALTTLLVGVTLGLAMLRSAGGYYTAEDTRQKRQAAIDLAEAGVDYAYWKVHYQCQKLPYTTDITMTSGTIHIEATDDGNREASTMLVTSTGTCGKHKHVIKRVTLGLLPYHYAWCEKHRIDDDDGIINSNSVGGIRTNDLVKLDKLSTLVTNGAWAVNTISTNGSIAPQYPGSPPIAFPEIDYAYYSSIASRKYLGDTWLFFPVWGLPNGVIYVTGRALIGGTYTGLYTIVATGDINVIWPLASANSSSFMALISTEKVKVDNSSAGVEAILYSHKADNTGDIEIRGYSSIRGSIAGDDIVVEHDQTINGNNKLNIDVMRQLKLPGL